MKVRDFFIVMISTIIFTYMLMNVPIKLYLQQQHYKEQYPFLGFFEYLNHIPNNAAFTFADTLKKALTLQNIHTTTHYAYKDKNLTTTNPTKEDNQKTNPTQETKQPTEDHLASLPQETTQIPAEPPTESTTETPPESSTESSIDSSETPTPESPTQAPTDSSEKPTESLPETSPETPTEIPTETPKTPIELPTETPTTTDSTQESTQTPPTPKEPQKPQETTPPKKPEYTLNKGDKILLIGDSLMQGVGMTLVSRLNKYGAKVINLSKQNTGLTYKKYFDWEQTLDKTLQENPDTKYIIALFGANDPWDMPNPQHQAKVLKFKSKEWEEVYRQRIEALLTLAQQYKAQIFWYQVPHMKDKKLDQNVAYLNMLYEEEVDKIGGVFLQSNTILSEKNHFSAYITDASQQKVKVRANDGIHFTGAGSRMLSTLLINQFTINRNESTQK